MESWLNSARLLKLERQLQCARMEATHSILCDIDMQYTDGNFDEEDARDQTVAVMVRHGPEAYWQQRSLLDDYEMLPEVRRMIATELCAAEA